MNDFGTFAKVLERDYLNLLRLEAPDTSASLAAVKSAVTASPDVEKELTRLLEDSNWRPHLVAAVAIAYIQPSAVLLSKCWETFDSGSWTTPQVAAVLCRRDKDFRERAMGRVRSGCPLINPPLYESPLHKHVVAGPELGSERASKSVSALVGLLRISSDREVRTLIDSPEVQRIIKADVDDGGGIARWWLERLESLMETAF